MQPTKSDWLLPLSAGLQKRMIRCAISTIWDLGLLIHSFVWNLFWRMSNLCLSLQERTNTKNCQNRDEPLIVIMPAWPKRPRFRARRRIILQSAGKKWFQNNIDSKISVFDPDFWWRVLKMHKKLLHNLSTTGRNTRSYETAHRHMMCSKIDLYGDKTIRFRGFSCKIHFYQISASDCIIVFWLVTCQ